jgi:hypothetical protein
VGRDHLGPRSVGERGVAVLLGTEPKFNAGGARRGFGGVPISFDVCWARPVS